MKVKLKNIICIIIAAIVLLSIWVGFSVLNCNREILIANATSEMDCHNYYDIIDGTGSSCYYEQIVTRSIDRKDSCAEYSNSHGPGREQGGTDILSTGCRSYMSLGFCYGTVDIPYWINMNSLNQIANEEHRNTIISDIRQQVSLWNEVVMHDGTGKLINFYEVSPGSLTKPSAINGRKVIEVLQDNLAPEEAGVFTPSKHTVTLNYNHDNARIAYNVDTIVHEFGHVLGLDDIDSANNVEYGTHNTLMSYERWTTPQTLNSAIQYQDIQGVAVANGIHTEHSYKRYVFDGKKYLHICFYCDRIDAENYVISDSKPVADASTCMHDYQQMVSAGERHWLKCTKCYKVIETKYTLRIIEKDSVNAVEITGLIDSNVNSISIPFKIGGQNVVSIADNAFIDNANLVEVYLTTNIINIGDNAFKNCVNLTSIKDIGSMIDIGTGAFYGCDSLKNIVIPKMAEIGNGAFVGCNKLNFYLNSSNPNYSVQDNILYNKDKTKIIAAGKIPSIVHMPNTVTEIAPSAFEGNTNLCTLDFGNINPIIDERAFADCTNLNEVYFFSYDIPTYCADSFYNDSFMAFVPYISQSDYARMFEQNDVDIAFVQALLSYVSNGQVVQQENVYYGSVLHSLYFPTQDGYSFDGWYRNSSLQGKPVSDGVLWEETADTSLYAKWQEVEYNIYFNLHGGALSGENPLPYTINDTLTFGEPTKTGHTFTGWTIDGQAVDGISTGTFGDIIVDANWQSNTYTITFDVDGGTPAIEPIQATYGQEFSIDIVPTKEGCYLDGWMYNGETYLDANGANLKLWNIAEDATLIAVWSPKWYYIQIGEDGNIWLDANGNLANKPSPIYCGTGLDLINLIDTFKHSQAGFKEGQIFVRFQYENKEINWLNGVPDLGQNGSVITIEPQWETEVHSIHFHAGGSDPLTISAKYGTRIEWPQPTRKGYVLEGWSTDEKGDNMVSWSTMPDLTPNDQNNGSCDLYAQYKEIEFEISYVLDGGINSVANPSVYSLESNLSLHNPSRVGYTFDGWYLDSSKTIKIEKIEDIVKKTDDTVRLKTIYAKWTPNKYTVILDRQEGTGGATFVQATFDSKLPTVAAPTRKGYDFKGYYSQVGGKGTQYYDSDMNGVEKWTTDGVVTLYAHWEKTVYTVRLYADTDAGGYYSQTVYVTYGSKMPAIDKFAPKRSGYTFVGFYSGQNGTGTQYYKMVVRNDEQGAAINYEGKYYREYYEPTAATWNEINGGTNVTLYGYFEKMRCELTYSNRVYEGGVLGTVSVGNIEDWEQFTLTAVSYDGYTFKCFYVDNDERPSPTDVRVHLERSTATGQIQPKVVIMGIYEENTCIAQGTLITLANGTQVPVESLKGDEMLLVWNMITGRLDAARIMFVDTDKAATYKVINLGFSDGTNVKVISEHGFWDYDLNKFVYLRSDASKYIGHWFNKGDVRVQLTSVEVRDEYTTAYSPVTYGHLCYFVNGMLSMPGGIDGLFNIFEVDPNTMTIDAEAMARDIATYGLFTYDEFAELVSVTEDVFNAFNGQYLKVAIGKGMITVEQLNNLADRYAEFFV